MQWGWCQKWPHYARKVAVLQVTCMLSHFKTLNSGPHWNLISTYEITKVLDKSWAGWNIREVATLSAKL